MNFPGCGSIAISESYVSQFVSLTIPLSSSTFLQLNLYDMVVFLSKNSDFSVRKTLRVFLEIHYQMKKINYKQTLKYPG